MVEGGMTPEDGFSVYHGGCNPFLGRLGAMGTRIAPNELGPCLCFWGVRKLKIRYGKDPYTYDMGPA